MAAIDELVKLSKLNKGIITTKAAAASGISRSMLSKLCVMGKIERISQGQYIMPGEMEDEMYSISLRNKRIVFSHETALFLHGLSDRVPLVHAVTAPANCVPPSSIREACKVYYIKPEMFSLGKTQLKTPAGNMVPAYDMERTICDAIRSRNRMGIETVLFAVKAYVKSPYKDLNELRKFAEALRIGNVLRRYLEVLL